MRHVISEAASRLRLWLAQRVGIDLHWRSWVVGFTKEFYTYELHIGPLKLFYVYGLPPEEPDWF